MGGVVDGGNGGGGGGRVVTELSHIMDLVRQLEGHLAGPQKTQEELCKNLTKQISSNVQRSISLITSYYLDGTRKRSAADAAAPSPLSDASDAPFIKITKKRKTMMDKVKHQVRVSSGGAGEVPADDGHSWRKYGQKDILGAKYPRGYYRCTHRHSQGCSATKQVQRTDEDPSLLDVIYIGAHTCVQNPAAGQPATSAPPPERNPGAHSLLHSLSSNLTVKTEGLAVAPPEQPPVQGWAAAAAATPLCLSSTPASGCLQERSPFSAAPSTSENWGASPATSDSNKQQQDVFFPPFEFVAGDVAFEFVDEVVSAFVDNLNDDFDISSFFA